MNQQFSSLIDSIPQSYSGAAVNSIDDSKENLIKYLRYLIKSKFINDSVYYKFNNFILNIHVFTNTSLDTSLNNLNLFIYNRTSKLYSLNSLQYIQGNNLFNISKCESYLRNKYSLPTTDPIYLISIEYSRDVNLDYDQTFKNVSTNSLFLYIYHSKFDFTNLDTICANNTIYYLVREKGLDNIRLINYFNYMKREGINVFLKESDFFKNQCFRYSSNNSFSYYTLGQRVSYFFPNVTVKCQNYKNRANLNDKCKFAEYYDLYAVCKCSILDEFSTGFFPDYVLNPSVYNFDLILCIPEVFDVISS
jgi:hypothetical protein